MLEIRLLSLPACNVIIESLHDVVLSSLSMQWVADVLLGLYTT